MKPLAYAFAAWIFFLPGALADERLDAAVRQYREALKDASPGELYVAMGDELFRAKRGPRNESLESCDFGVGPGVLRGAYSQLPRFFADSGKVEDLESRLMTCMARIQGFGEEAFPRHARGDPRMAELRRLAIFIASQSNGMPLAAPLEHAREAEAYRIGEQLFYRRAGAPPAAALRLRGIGRAAGVSRPPGGGRRDRSAGDQAMKRALAALAAALFTGSPSSFGQADLAERTEAAFVASFAGGDRAVFVRAGSQDEVQRLCSEHRNAPPAPVAEAIERFQRAAIRYPASLSGDWREGKRIAEDFTGMRYGDPRGQPNGGNCYACHQIEAREIAYGTLGPSLAGYGKARGWGVAAQRLAYERIFNAQAFAACSAVPRFGHNGVLTPEQVAHLVALLLDPTSPVNR